MAKMIGEVEEEYGASNPHPGFGKDDNIANEKGHTHYPKFVHEFNEQGKIVEDIEYGLDDKGKKIILSRTPHSRMVNDEDEENEAIKDGFSAIWVKPKVEKKPSVKNVKDPFAQVKN